MSFSTGRDSVLVMEWDKTSVSQFELMVCFQYKKLGCLELSILNYNRTIS